MREMDTSGAHIFHLFAQNHLEWLLRDLAQELCLSPFSLALNLQLHLNAPCTVASWLIAVSILTGS